MPRPVNKEIRKLIVLHRRNGMRIKDIANIFDISCRTVINICKNETERGTVSPKKSSGRPRSTSSNEDQQLCSMSETNPFLSAKAIRKEMDLAISVQTVRSR